MYGIYDFNSSKQLFEHLKFEFTEFHRAPSLQSIYRVIFPLYHLREWICPHGYEGSNGYKKKPRSSWTKAESFHSYLHENESYQVLRQLCNNAKHFNDSDINNKTAKFEGKRFGLSYCGDSYGITHFMVEGKEIRKILWEVYSAYFEYFKSNMANTDVV